MTVLHLVSVTLAPSSGPHFWHNPLPVVPGLPSELPEPQEELDDESAMSVRLLPAPGGSTTSGGRTRGDHLKGCSLREQLTNRAFGMTAYFAMVHILRINYYVGTASKQLAHLGDGASGYSQCRILMLI